MGNVKFAATVYGIGQTGRKQDVESWQEFQKLKPGEREIVAGFNEADYDGAFSSGLIQPDVAARKWDQVMRAHKEKGVALISPSCAKQLDENWMGPFLNKVEVKPDMVSVHAFSDDPEFILKVLDHYRQFGYKMAVTEFACINFRENKKCNQEQTIAFIYRAVEIFENDDQVLLYSYPDTTNGDYGLLTENGQGKKLSKTGWAYRDAISKHSKAKRDEIFLPSSDDIV
ncbi:hypothetical protein CBS101457_005381 [Exobasidium rhododendri]|nr:hypothetical protein CBS101457_005381 [Exobasidium rhododendri]